MRLRDFPSERHTWHDLSVFIQYLGDDSRLYAEVYPDRAGWNHTTLLLAAAVDELRWLHWSNTEGSRDGTVPAPEPIPRPGVQKPQGRPGSRVKPMTLERGKEVFDRPDRDRASKLYGMFRSA